MVASVPYILDILKGKTRPNKASWVIWSVTTTILFFSYFFVGARATIFLPAAYVLNCFIILFLSFKYGSSSPWSRLDIISISVAGFSLIIWFLTKNPLLALLMNLTMDAVAYLPTIKKSYTNPISENTLAWALFFLGACFNLLAINDFSFQIVIHPLVMFLMNSAVLAVLLHKKFLI